MDIKSTIVVHGVKIFFVEDLGFSDNTHNDDDNTGEEHPSEGLQKARTAVLIPMQTMHLGSQGEVSDMTNCGGSLTRTLDMGL